MPKNLRFCYLIIMFLYGEFGKLWKLCHHNHCCHLSRILVYTFHWKVYYSGFLLGDTLSDHLFWGDRADMSGEYSWRGQLGKELRTSANILWGTMSCHQPHECVCKCILPNQASRWLQAQPTAWLWPHERLWTRTTQLNWIPDHQKLWDKCLLLSVLSFGVICYPVTDTRYIYKQMIPLCGRLDVLLTSVMFFQHFIIENFKHAAKSQGFTVNTNVPTT